ncbi:hypothetical protein [Marimonas lutisalis]|uniref:hypothetical protein n=1 Tax=Marimonas lutisalis TaxID=2545756 RepID=UPI0010F9E7ED|nr:hypothetical protein [Marimonas lutisalis]
MPNTPFDTRITFHDDLQIMEADFSGFTFDSSQTVNAFYDRIEERIAATGETQWFFLVNYSGCVIDSSAWVAFSRRGKALNLAHSMGSVRFDASEATRAQIQRDANTERFDPNLFADRDAALARLAELPSSRRARIVHDPNYTLADFVRRISFDPDGPIMHVDFSHFTFHHARDVDDFYDYIEERIIESDRKWFFLVDLEGCQILPGAWVRYAYRGKRLNKAASLGTVRFAPGSETEEDIRLRAQSQGFEPNIRNTRDEALARIAEMKAALLTEMG